MSNIQLQSLTPGRSTLVAVLGDAIDLLPLDQRLSHSYAITSHPGGSSASFSSSIIAPDVAGAYVFTITAAGDVLKVSAFVFALNVYTTLKPSTGTYSDAEKRSILTAIVNANALTPTQLTAWNAGTFPSLNLSQFGGR
jgi:hypothetical protein